MKCLKKIVRHYWKYQYQTWTQPILVENGTIGGDSFAVDGPKTGANYPVWAAFGNTTSFWAGTDSKTVAVNLYIYNPNPLKISSLYWKTYNNNRYPTTWEWYGSNDNSTWTLINSGTNNTNEFTLTLDNTNGYKYFKFYIPTNNNGINAKTITLTGSQRVSIEGTSSNYDYYTDDLVYHIPNKIVRHYWKYQYNTFSQPSLVENGTIGGDSFAMNQSSVYSDSYAYKALPNSGKWWHSAQTIPAWIEWYNPNPLRIDRLYFEVGNSSTNKDYPKDYKIQGSDDGINWNDVYTATNSATTPFPLPIEIDLSGVQNREYKYWRYYIETVLGRSFGNMRNLQITGAEKVSVAGTSTNYDYYTDDLVRYAINKKTRHYWKYIWSSWTQPVLTDFTTPAEEGNIVVTESGHYTGSGEHEYAWYIMDGIKSGSSINTFWTSAGDTRWCKVVLPYNIKITGIRLYNYWQGKGAGAHTGSIYTDETMTTPIGNDYSMPAGNWATVDIAGIPTEGIITNSFYITVSGNGIGEIEITAQQRKTVPGTPTDYDYYTDDDI